MSTPSKPSPTEISRTPIEKARGGGYSDDEIFNYLSKKPEYSESIEKASKGGYSPNEIISHLTQKQAKEELAKHPHGLASFIAQHPGQAAAGVGIENIAHPLEIISSLSEPAGILKAIINKKIGVPVTEKLRELSGTNELPEWAKDEATILNFMAGLLPVERLGNIIPKGIKAALNKSGLVPPSPKKSPVQAIYEERAAVSPHPENLVPETFKSGLSKPSAVESKHRQLATISKERQKTVIGNLDKEAQGLFKSKLSERVPITKRIEEGFDFEGNYQKDFGNLKSVAEKYNPDIQITPLSKFFSETRDKYRGIPEPHGDAKRILREISSFRKEVPSELKELLKIRRSNGQKLGEIYEQRLLKGKKKEYVNFLNEMNRKIDESIGHTLPENSPWFKEYKDLNAGYTEYKNAQATLRILEPLFKEKIGTSALTKIADNVDKQKYLRLKMGEEGANEVIQLAKDLKKARESIKDIPVKSLSKFDAVWPISWVFKPLGIATTIKKGIDYGRKAYGYILSNPKNVKAFDSMLEAVVKNDLPAYEKAASKLKD